MILLHAREKWLLWLELTHTNEHERNLARACIGEIGLMLKELEDEKGA
jgi:hypothetical protein